MHVQSKNCNFPIKIVCINCKFVCNYKITILVTEFSHASTKLNSNQEKIAFRFPNTNIWSAEGVFLLATMSYICSTSNVITYSPTCDII